MKNKYGKDYIIPDQRWVEEAMENPFEAMDKGMEQYFELVSKYREGRFIVFLKIHKLDHLAFKGKELVVWLIDNKSKVREIIVFKDGFVKAIDFILVKTNVEEAGTIETVKYELKENGKGKA